ncbi:MAG: thioredoxin domain-containing protein [Armatimonadota bacterium]
MTTLIALSAIAGFLDTPSKGFTDWQTALAGKKSVSATVTINEVGGVTSSYKIDMKKPASLRLETTEETIVADGTNITVFSKKDNVFYKKPQTAEELKVTLNEDQYAMFSGFFGSAPKVVKTVDAGSRTLGGEPVNEVKAFFDKSGKKTTSFFVSPDGVARRANLTAEAKGQSKPKQLVFSAKNVVIDGAAVDTLFAFKAPTGSTEMSYEDFFGSRWVYDFDEAMMIAKKTNKGIFVDFMASWCGPCKMMAATAFDTPEFKAFGKKVVFCQIDIDLNPALAEKYGVEAIPNVFVLKSDGTKVGSILGWSGLSTFMSKMDGLVNSL